MSAERRAVLEMLKDGTVTVEEAEQLLDIVDNHPDRDRPQHGAIARFVVVTVTEGGFVRSNTRLPLTLIRTGLKLGKNIATLGGRLEGSREYVKILDTLQGIDFDSVIASVNSGEIQLPCMLAEIEEGPRRTEFSLQ